nr:MAG TPA: hypothetical protein [Caudoviricetes sp.]
MRCCLRHGGSKFGSRRSRSSRQLRININNCIRFFHFHIKTSDSYRHIISRFCIRRTSYAGHLQSFSG